VINKVKIGITGAHGVGKTTFLYKLASDYKTKKPELSVGILPEVARYCPMPINRKTVIESQQWIFCTQMAEELKHSYLNDVLICDRTILDNIAYAKYAGFDSWCENALNIAVPFLATYTEIIYIRPSGKDVYDDGVRDTDIAFQYAIDDILSKYMLEYIENVGCFRKTHNCGMVVYKNWKYNDR